MEKINEAMVREIVKKVLAEMMTAEDFVKEKDASGILKVKTDTVRCEPFSDTPGVYLKDIVSLEEAPRMGAGIMELDRTSFEWTLTYDISGWSYEPRGYDVRPAGRRRCRSDCFVSNQ